MYNLASYRTILLILAVGILLVGAFDALTTIREVNVTWDYKDREFVRKGSEMWGINLILKMLLPALLSGLAYMMVGVIDMVQDLRHQIWSTQHKVRTHRFAPVIQLSPSPRQDACAHPHTLRPFSSSALPLSLHKRQQRRRKLIGDKQKAPVIQPERDLPNCAAEAPPVSGRSGRDPPA